MRVILPRHIYKQFLEEVRKSRYEVCGLLLGVKSGEEVSISKLYIAENLDKSPVRFTIDPYTMLKAFEDAEEMGMEVVGVIHSHPAPPSPSNLDLENMSRWPVVWIIIDSNTGEAAAWIYKDGLKKLSLDITD